MVEIGELLVLVGIFLLIMLFSVLFTGFIVNKESSKFKVSVVILIAFFLTAGGLGIIQTEQDANRGAPRSFDLDNLTPTTFAVRTDSHVIFCSENLFNVKDGVLCFRNPIGEFRKKDLKKLPYVKESCGPWIGKLPSENKPSSDKQPLVALDSFYTECP